MLEIGIIIVLSVVVLFQVADRYFIIEQNQREKDKLLDELSKAIKAVIAKNAHDYVMTTSIDKVPSEDKPARNPDEIPEEALSDDQFFEAIGKSLKDEKK